METYTAERRTAVHEAGHAVMAYLLHRPFTTISVTADDDSYGRVHCAPFGDWFQPDIQVTSRVRTRIEHHVMIALAGAEAEAHWVTRRAHGAPADWEDRLKVGCAHDMSAAVDLAWYACGSAEETSAYIEWLRQRVLNKVDRWNTEGKDDPAQIGCGNPTFWRLVDVLADAVVAAGTLQWRQAKNVLQAADPLLAAVRNHVTSVSSVRKPSTENGPQSGDIGTSHRTKTPERPRKSASNETGKGNSAAVR